MTTDCFIELPRLHPKQRQAFESAATDLLFGGATRGGKSYFVRYALINWCARIPGLQCDIFRLYFDDVIAEAMEGETGFPALLAPAVQMGLVKITQTEVRFWNGSLISLEHASDPSQVKLKHQGIAKHVRVFVESTQIDATLIKWLSAWVTMSADMLSRIPPDLAGRFPRIIHVTNPIGPSSTYYRREYVEPRDPYTIGEVGHWKRQYIPALVEDNPSENAESTRQRVKGMGDAAIADALLNANWNALVGDFFPEYDERRHVVLDFIPPQHLFRFRSFDWGTAEPFVVYWIAVSDGEPFYDQEGYERWFPRGALLFYQEWNGADLQDPSKGLRMRNEDIAAGIIARSELGRDNIITLTDSKPFQDMGGESIALTFQKCGVPLTRADTSRVAGWSQLRSRLIGVEIDSNSQERVPMIFFCQSCRAARNYIPALPRHPSENKKEDAAEHGEATHACDAIRYACMVHAAAVIKDKKVPTEARIQKAVRSERPTMKKILGGAGRGYFN